MAQGDWVPRMQFRSGYLVAYSQYEGTRKVNQSAFKDTKKSYSGDITPGSKKRLRKCVDLLLQISPEHIIFNPVTNDYQPFSVNFITLTVPNEKTLSARWCHKNLLEPFLRVMRKKYGLRHYIWKCERQERGQIHYHLTTDTFIIWTDIRNSWNNTLRSTGLMKEFIIKHKHANPNSTDVHAVYKVKNLSAYLCKYLRKPINGDPLDAKVWDASKSLKNAKPFTSEPTARDQCALEYFTQNKKATCTELEHCKIYKPISGQLRDITSPDVYAQYTDYIKTVARS